MKKYIEQILHALEEIKGSKDIENNISLIQNIIWDDNIELPDYFYDLAYDLDFYDSNKNEQIKGNFYDESKLDDIASSYINKIKKNYSLDLITKAIPDTLLQRGIKTQDGKGIAFYAQDLIEISKYLQKANIAVLGGDAMVLDDNKNLDYSLTYENWYLDRDKNDSFADFVKKSNEKMISYVTKLNKTHPHFMYLITLSEEV